MSLRFNKVIPILLIAVTFSGCVSFSRTKIKLDPAFWENQGNTIAINISPYPLQGHAYRYVSGGMLPGYMTETRLAPSLTSFALKYDYSEFNNIKSRFTDELIKRSMKVLPFDDKSFSPIYGELLKSKNIKPELMNALRKQTKADYVLMFWVIECGIKEEGYPFHRSYDGLISVNANLVDLRTGEFKWSNKQSRRVVRASGEWDQPPDYPNIAMAMHEVISKVTNELYESFFGLHLD